MKSELYCGDCLEVMKQIPDNSVDLVLTDPPYKIITGGRKDGVNSKRPNGILSENKNFFQNKIPDMSLWIAEAYRTLKLGSHCYIFTNLLNLQKTICESMRAGFKLHNLLIWEKNNCTPSQYYMKNCEYVLFLRKGKAKYINNIGDSKTVHRFNNVVGNKLHPTEKPVELMEYYLLNSSNLNDIVLDPFMGSGSTGVAATKNGRKFIGIEINKEYFQIAQKRIEEASRQEETNE